MPFDIVEIQKNIEEKRLIFGQKLESFIINRINGFAGCVKNYLYKFLAQKQAVFFSCFIIISLAIFAFSTRDIGIQSAINLDSAAGVVGVFSFFATRLSSLAGVSVVMVVEIVILLLGIISIYISAKILFSVKEKNHDQKIITNITIIAFCAAYFLRFYTLQFGEYHTFASYFLALAFPYIALKNISLNSFLSTFITAILAGLIIAINPIFVVLPIVFEVADFFSSKKNKFFYLRNLITLLFVVVFFYFTQSITPVIASVNFVLNNFDLWNFYLLKILKEDVFFVLLLGAVALPYFSQKQIFKPSLLLVASAFAIAIINFDGAYDLRAVFFALSFNFIFLIVYFLIMQQKINWRKDGLLALLILFLPQFDAANFFAFILNLCYFWWVILFIDRKADNCLFVFALITVALTFLDKTGQISWLFSALIFLSLFKEKISVLARKNSIENPAEEKISRASLIFICLALSYFLSLLIAAIFNYNNSYAAILKSPNSLTESEAFFINKYASKNDDEVIFINNETANFYPLKNYLGKNSLILENKGWNNYQENLIEQASNKKNKLIFVARGSKFSYQCEVGFLEYSFDNQKFKKIFTNEYIFLGEIVTTRKDKMLSKQLLQASTKDVFEEREFITNQIEVYVRKN